MKASVKRRGSAYRFAGSVVALSLATLSVLRPSPALSAPSPTSAARSVNWKLFFNQLFALEIRKEMSGQGASQADIEAAIIQHTGFTPGTFNDTINKVLGANTSAEAFNIRHKIYDDQQNYWAITGPNFKNSIPASTQNIPAIKDLLATINQNRERQIGPEENFFNSAEGQSFVRGITATNRGQGNQQVALVLVPGYAAHVIKFAIFPEILGDANQLWGRPISRPVLADKGLDVTYEAHTTFYGRGANEPHPFDILTPSGWELGNTVGFNGETADLLANWLTSLPPSYANTKFIFLGYSKGAPAIFEMLQRHPELKSRTTGIITFAGAVQGTHIARVGRKEISGTLGARSIADLITKIRSKGGAEALESMAPFLTSFDLSAIKLPKVKEVLNSYGFEVSDLDEKTNRILDGRELREVVDGIIDLEPSTRSLWNMLHFDRDLLAPGTFVFNLSGVTDISTFASRRISGQPLGNRTSLLAPMLTGDNKIDWQHFSLDAWFLYLSSQSGFKLAPGGLYDTQVDLQHTKTPWLDASPLSASLTESELQALWDNAEVRQRAMARGAQTYDDFKAAPRSKLMDAEGANQIGAFDLGEYKGHHWSLFLQAFRPPVTTSAEFAVWTFPRKAMMRALLQTFALYNIASQY